MPSVQRFFSGQNNLARAAALAATSVRASTAIERTSAQRSGGGRVLLAGSYTGHEAAEVDVEIVSAGGVPRASVPQFVGVGNGTLAVLGVDAGAPLQALTLTLADLGIDTVAAWLDVREARIVSAAAGSAGNSISITVTPSLTRAATSYALLSAWSTGTELQSGDQWNFGGLTLNSRGELDAGSPRIQFGFDPQVYRPYRTYKEGAWQYGVSPALERDVPAGAAVYAVTGGYVVTVTDGATTEIYGDTGASQPEIVTFYDLLTALQASALVQVAGVVAADRTVGGQAAVDVPLRTQAWLCAIGTEVPLRDVVVPAGAPTQAVTVKCINADVVGRERWGVSGDVSGTLAVATTGEAYASAAVNFVVPVQDPATVDSGEWSFKFNAAAREEDAGLPSVCVRPFRFGVNAKARTVTFRYQKRPPAECKCSDVPTPRVSLACLGLEGESMALDAEYQSRLENLYEWRRDFMASNTGLPAADDAIHDSDVPLINGVTSVFAQALSEIYESAPALAEWDLAFADMQVDLAALNGTSGGDDDLYEKVLAAKSAGVWVDEYVAAYVQRYSARMDYCRALAGIVPKFESSGSDAGSCWTDHGGSYWWADVDGYYLPAFTNEAYISARRNTETGEAYSTQEFGFGLVVACPDRLKVGDEITISIDQVDGERPYDVGDTVVLQTIAAGAAQLAGGVDGTDEQTWRVGGSASGALADYVVPTDGTAAPVYTAAGIDLRLALGGIPFELGDVFTLAVEAGQYRWRMDGGAWSAPADIPGAGAVALADGLMATFEAGAAPSFALGDAYTFAVHQPWAVSHVQAAGVEAWGWAGAAAQLVIDLGSVQVLGAVALARYALPAGAVVTVETSNDSVAWAAALPLDVSRAVSVLFMPSVSARYLRLAVSAAAGGSIGWVWAGVPMATDHHASKCARRRRWAVGRGSGLNPDGLFAGLGDGWSLGWSPDDWTASRLLQTDLQGLLPLLDWAQQQDEPLIFVPHHLHPEDAALVRFEADALEITDTNEYQPNDKGQRFLSATLELEPVYA